MNETQRALFAAAHAGDTMSDINTHLSGTFLLIIGILILLLLGWWIIDTVLNWLFTVYNYKPPKNLENNDEERVDKS